MLGVIVTGCSNTPAGTGSSGGNSTAATNEKAVKFAECMRDNGVSEFPDPDASGIFAYGIAVNVELEELGPQLREKADERQLSS